MKSSCPNEPSLVLLLLVPLVPMMAPINYNKVQRWPTGHDCEFRSHPPILIPSYYPLRGSITSTTPTLF
jgi:hypothetical protein